MRTVLTALVLAAPLCAQGGGGASVAIPKLRMIEALGRIGDRRAVAELGGAGTHVTKSAIEAARKWWQEQRHKAGFSLDK